jgi:hypothetical protein
MCVICNRIRGLREWSELPRMLARLPLVNFQYNPHVAPTEQIPAFLAERGKSQPTARVAVPFLRNNRGVPDRKRHEKTGTCDVRWVGYDALRARH